MTAATKTPPARLKRRNYGRGHGYQLDGQKIVGVTTAIDVLDKPALRNWYADQAAKRAVDEWDRIAEMPMTERYEFIKWGPRDTVRAAALRGTEIHALGEKVANGEDVDVPAEHRGPVEAYARFLDKWDVEMIATETPLCHTEHGYGGTADGWARIGRLGGMPVLLDVKTGRGVYDEVGLQLAAYRFSNLCQIDGVEVPTPEVERVFVAHVMPDDVRMVPVVADEQVFRLFLHILHVHRARQAWSDWPLVGSAVQPGEELP